MDGGGAAAVVSSDGRNALPRSVSFGNRPERPGVCAQVVLAQERIVGRLRGQVIGQVLAGDQRLERVAQQQPLRTRAVGVVEHDAALEAQVDEGVVLRVALRLRERQAPDLHVEQGEQIGVAATVREGSGERDRLRERLIEPGRLALEGIRRVLLQIGDDRRSIVGAVGLGRRRDDRTGSSAGNVEPLIVVYGSRPSSSRYSGRTPFGVTWTTCRWKNCGRRPHEREGPGRRHPERVGAATLVEVVPDLVVVDPEAGIREVPGVLLGADGRSRPPARSPTIRTTSSSETRPRSSTGPR